MPLILQSYRSGNCITYQNYGESTKSSSSSSKSSKYIKIITPSLARRITYVTKHIFEK